VTGAVVTRTGTALGQGQATFGDNAANFADLGEYELRIRSSGALFTASVARAGLYVKLENLGRGEAYYRLARTSTGIASAYFDGMRALINPASFSNPLVYAEAVGYASAAGVNSFQFFDAGTNDSGTTSSAITASALTLPGAKARLRSSALTITPGNRTIGRSIGNGAATTNLTSGTAIVQFSY